MTGGDSTFSSRATLAGGVDQSRISPKLRRYTYDNFDVRPIFMASTGNPATAIGGATGNVNTMRTGAGCYEWHVKGTQTILIPAWDATTGKGLDFTQDDAAANDGHETSFCPNVVTSGGGRSKHGFTVGGTSAEPRPFFAQFTFLAGDTSGIGEGFFGFIKQEAYQATVAAYTEYAGLSAVGSGTTAAIKIKTRLASGTAGDVDTTQTVADGIGVTFRVEVNPASRVATFKYGAALTQAQIDAGTVPFPTVTKTDFAFTSGCIVRPAFFFLQAADLVATLYYQNFTCGYLPARPGE